MWKRISAMIILMLVLALSGVGQETKGRYLLVYKERIEYSLIRGGSQIVETESHKWFQTHEEAIGWMNESNRVSKKMFVSLNFVVQLETVQEDGKWIIKP